MNSNSQEQLISELMSRMKIKRPEMNGFLEGVLGDHGHNRWVYPTSDGTSEGTPLTAPALVGWRPPVDGETPSKYEHIAAPIGEYTGPFLLGVNETTGALELSKHTEVDEVPPATMPWSMLFGEYIDGVGYRWDEKRSGAPFGAWCIGYEGDGYHPFTAYGYAGQVLTAQGEYAPPLFNYLDITNLAADGFNGEYVVKVAGGKVGLSSLPPDYVGLKVVTPSDLVMVNSGDLSVGYAFFAYSESEFGQFEIPPDWINKVSAPSVAGVLGYDGTDYGWLSNCGFVFAYGDTVTGMLAIPSDRIDATNSPALNQYPKYSGSNKVTWTNFPAIPDVSGFLEEVTPSDLVMVNGGSVEVGYALCAYSESEFGQFAIPPDWIYEVPSPSVAGVLGYDGTDYGWLSNCGFVFAYGDTVTGMLAIPSDRIDATNSPALNQYPKYSGSNKVTWTTFPTIPDVSDFLEEVTPEDLVMYNDADVLYGTGYAFYAYDGENFGQTTIPPPSSSQYQMLFGAYQYTNPGGWVTETPTPGSLMFINYNYAAPAWIPTPPAAGAVLKTVGGTSDPVFESMYIQELLSTGGAGTFVLGVDVDGAVSLSTHTDTGDSLPEGNEGDMLYNDGSDWVALDTPTDPSILVSYDGSPVWITPAYDYQVPYLYNDEIMFGDLRAT